MPGPGLKLLKLRTHVTTIFSPPPTTNSAPADDAYDDAYMLACAVRACNGQQKCDVYPSSVCSVLKVQQQADKNTAEACYPLQEAGERGGTPPHPPFFLACGGPDCRDPLRRPALLCSFAPLSADWQQRGDTNEGAAEKGQGERRVASEEQPDEEARQSTTNQGRRRKGKGREEKQTARRGRSGDNHPTTAISIKKGKRSARPDEKKRPCLAVPGLDPGTSGL